MFSIPHPGKESGQMEYLDVEEVKVATTATTTKSSNRQANSNLLIVPVKTQVAMLLLFCKNPEI